MQSRLRIYFWVVGGSFNAFDIYGHRIKKIAVGTIAVLTFSGLSCGFVDNATRPHFEDKTEAVISAPVTLLKSSQQRETNPTVATDVVAQQVAGNTAFAFDLYHQLISTSSHNLFCNRSRPNEISVDSCGTGLAVAARRSRAGEWGPVETCSRWGEGSMPS